MSDGWIPFDYDLKPRSENPLPAPHELVWVYERFYEEGVTVGYFDSYTWRTASGSDDCSVSHWRRMERPHPPWPAGR